ncbi:hypothetical protein H4R35_004244 [Dimargaris xerosporica]|nr:hypothetical protein H4R35_004244 [Dimargaris xerosporica]
MGWKKFLPPAIKTRWRDNTDFVPSTTADTAAVDTGLARPSTQGPLPTADGHLQPPEPLHSMPGSATLPRPSPMGRSPGWRQKYLSWLPQDNQVVQQIMGTKAPSSTNASPRGSPPQLPPRPSRYDTARTRREDLGSKHSPNFHRSHLDLAAAHDQLFTMPVNASSTQSLPMDVWPRPLFMQGSGSPVSPTLRVPALVSEEEPLEPPSRLDRPMDDELRRMSFVRLLDHCPGPASPEMRRSRTSSSVSIDSAQSDLMAGRFMASSPLARCSYSAHDPAMGELMDTTTSPADSDKRSSLRNGWEGLKTWSYGVRQRSSLASVTPTESRPRLPLRLDARYHTWLRDGAKERAKKLRHQVERLLERPLSYMRPASTVDLAPQSPTRSSNAVAPDAQQPPASSFTLTSMTCVTSPLLHQRHPPSPTLEPPSLSIDLPNRRSSLTTSSLPLGPSHSNSDSPHTHGLALGITSTQSPSRNSTPTGTLPRHIASELAADDATGEAAPLAQSELPPILPTRTSSLHSICSTRSMVAPARDVGPTTLGSSQTPRTSAPLPVPYHPSDSGTDLADLPPLTVPPTISTLSAMHDPVEDQALLSTPIPKPFAHPDAVLPVDHAPPRFPRLNTKNLRLATPTTRSPTSPLSLGATTPETPSLRQSPTSHRSSTTPRSVSTPSTRPWYSRPLSPDGGGSLSAVLPLLNPTPTDAHPPLPPLSPPVPAASVPISGQAKDWRSGSALTTRPPPLSSSPRNSSELGVPVAIPEPDDHLTRRPSYPLPLDALPRGDGVLTQTLTMTESADECMQRALTAQDRGEIAKATLLFRQAALQGSSIGLFFYGLSLRHGWGCKANPDFGFQCLQKAVSYALHELKAGIESVAQTSIAKQELTIALYELAVCYQNGWGVATNAEAAAFYFEIAANLGDPDAQNDIAFCYMNGKGVPVDKAIAAKYFRMADKQGAGIVGNSWIFKSKYTEGSRLPV